MNVEPGADRTQGAPAPAGVLDEADAMRTRARRPALRVMLKACIAILSITTVPNV
jgi:hypothetical protein